MTGAAKIKDEPINEEPKTPPVAPVPDADPDRTYLAFIAVPDDSRELWEELGKVSAPTKPEAWAKAKSKWPQLEPAAPTSPQDDERTVRAKLIPQRYGGTIESTMEYVPPRAVTKGI